MRRNIGFYVTVKTSGQRVFMEKQWKWDRWYFTADGWTTQATSKLEALELAGVVVRTSLPFMDAREALHAACANKVAAMQEP